MTKHSRPEDHKRVGGVRRAGDLVAPIAGQAFKRFGFVQSAVVERWEEIVGEKYAALSCPESIRFPSGAKRGGTLTLKVEGAQAPLFQHLAPMILDRVNDFFGAGAVTKVVFKQGRVERPVSPVKRPQVKPVPAELGEGLRDIPDPELRACLEALAASLDEERPAPPPINIPVLGRIGDPRRETNDQ
ncbi:DciA family protein [Sphingomicrobium sp. XHP0235]|uniref:DUF721 domain-containing protein n=1 Tax=Sphingomicrobium aquimarinum TaxID=3133971 RepID=UPI0031FEFDA9